MSAIATEQFKPSERVSRMQPSATMEAMATANALRRQGRDVVDLGAGEPDFDTPDHIKKAAEEAMWAGQTKYTPNSGTAEFQSAVSQYFEREFKANVRVPEIMATAGGKQAIFNAVVSLINPGDDVLIVKPYWVTFPEIVTFAGGRSVFVETEENGFGLTVESLESALTERTRLVILNSPSNPSGRVIAPSEFERIVNMLHDRGIFVISDECYLRFVYQPSVPFTAASLPAEIRNKLCVAGSLSKTYAMTGWRIGFAIAPEPWIKAMLRVQGHSTSGPNSIAQAAAVAALNSSQQAVEDMLAEYAKRREWLIGALNSIPGIKCFPPEGAFYAFPSVKGCLTDEIRTSGEFAAKLLEQTYTVVTDGAAFGAEGYLRISYATSIERLKEGVARIRALAEQSI